MRLFAPGCVKNDELYDDNKWKTIFFLNHQYKLPNQII